MFSMVILTFLLFLPIEIITEFLAVRTAAAVQVHVHDVSGHPICSVAAAFRPG
jgi:hypothetical protein